MLINLYVGLHLSNYAVSDNSCGNPKNNNNIIIIIIIAIF